jgi:type II secretory pathway pseudopilin PulG
VEILAAVAIIAILVGLLYKGAKYVGASSRARSTQVTLKTLENLLTEFETRGGRMEILNDQYSGQGGQEIMPQGPVVDDFAFSNPQMNDPLKRTQQVMLQLMTVPENKSIIEKLPQELFLKDPATNLPAPGPILLDAWHSPILFAPGRASTGPGMNTWGAAGMFITNDPNSNDPSKPDKGKSDPSIRKAFFKQPNGKGMFVSAGEDTDFSLGDDNLYTFEK